jgi:hypothetical protein
MTSMRQFDVRIGDHLVAELIRPSAITARDLRRTLIDEGWPFNISVYRNNQDKTAYDDMSRYSKSEEW